MLTAGGGRPLARWVCSIPAFAGGPALRGGVRSRLARGPALYLRPYDSIVLRCSPFVYQTSHSESPALFVWSVEQPTVPRSQGSVSARSVATWRQLPTSAVMYLPSAC